MSNGLEGKEKGLHRGFRVQLEESMDLAGPNSGREPTHSAMAPVAEA